MSEEDQPAPTAAEWASRIARNPAILVILAGPVATYVMSEYVNPAVVEGIEAHASDPNAHPVQFERLDAIEARIAAMEKRAGQDTDAILDLLAEMKGER